MYYGHTKNLAVTVAVVVVVVVVVFLVFPVAVTEKLHPA